MNRYYDSHFQKNIVTIHPGEYFASSEDELISTILGSCISIVLFDKAQMIGGMNHFMLAYDGSDDNVIREGHLVCEYGEYAVELLLNDLYKKRAKKSNLIAKVFGGSNMFNISEESTVNNVGKTNILFAFSYLEREHIPITSSDTGGTLPRKIFFNPITSKIWLKRIITTHIEKEKLLTLESSYIESIKTKEKDAGSIVWF